MNFNRMTIRQNGGVFNVLKLKPYQIGYATNCRHEWAVSPVASARFSGTREQCEQFIRSVGAVYQSEAQ